MRQIRMLRAMRRELETALRILLTGHEGGNPGYSQGESYGLPRQLSTLPLKAQSLNEAYRKISEVFEPARRSKGGNVFRSFYYRDTNHQQWRPIGELRGDVIFISR